MTSPVPMTPRRVWRNRLLARTLLDAVDSGETEASGAAFGDPPAGGEAMETRRPGGPLLDAGCGFGVLAELLAAGDRELWAFDLDRRRVGLAASPPRRSGLATAGNQGARKMDEKPAVAGGRSDNRRWLAADVRALPFPDGRFAGIAVGEVLEHVDDDEAALAELARALQPGGVLALTVPAGARRFGSLDRMAGHVRRYDRVDVERLLVEAGLEVMQLRSWGFPFGRFYDRWVQRPALTSRGPRRRAWMARVGQAGWVVAAWGVLFEADEWVARLAGVGQTGRGSGWLAVGRKPGG